MSRSDWIMVALFSQYIFLTLVSAFEGKLGPVLYWLGAVIIISGAFLMKRGL